jgi:hypothetical protein
VATTLLAFAIGRELGLTRPTAVFFALLVTIASGRLMNAARLNLFCTEFLLLFLYAGLCFWKSGGILRALGFGFAAALLLLQSQPLFFQGGVLVALLFVVLLVGAPKRLVVRLPGLLVAAVLCGALCWPFLKAMWEELQRSPAVEQSFALWSLGSLDASALVLPTARDRFHDVYSTLLPLRASSFYEEGGVLGTVSHFPGVGWLALIAAAALARGEKAGRRALLLALALLVVALGPALKWMGEPLVTLPYAALQYAPMLALEKSPERFVWLVQLALAFAAARGAERLALAEGGGWRQRAGPLAAFLACLALVEQGETLPLTSIDPRVRVPDEITAMAREPRFAVLDLPWDGVPPEGSMSHVVNAMAMGFGASHEQRIFFGLYPRAARKGLAELEARPLFAAIRGIETSAREKEPPPGLDDAALEEIRKDMADLSIGAVQLHDVQFDPERWPGERQRLLDFLRRLRPKSEARLEPGKGYSLTLFRF